ncbi:alpha-ketoglutarate dehydrogenase component 4 [Cavia porcellus]|uniref:alpha-ketoglutarate dehydrogenase component 4 n=1 Tax=Cavia porcellus TaxID=10141 RepID=UPI002FE3D0E1
MRGSPRLCDITEAPPPTAGDCPYRSSVLASRKLPLPRVMMGSKMASASRVVQPSKGSKSPEMLIHPGPPDTAEILKTLPQKYRRKLISQEEMEFIQRGGPE